jgi:AraC-like DNA-binding protein
MKIAFEKIIPEAGSSFAILDKRAPRFDGRFHFHPEVEITLIENGTGRRVVGDSIEPFAPGDLVLIGEDLPHQYVSDPSSNGTRDVARAKVIQFRTSCLGDTWLELPEFTRIATMLSSATRGLKFSNATTRRASQLIEDLFAATEVKRLTLLLELLDVLARDGRAAPIASDGYLSKINTREGDAIDRALEYLNTNYTEPVTLDELSGHLHVSPATCNRLLQKSIGRSFKTALIEIRISHACRLLLETNQSIVEVAYASGFTNLSNFNRRFKEMKGRSPKAYRNLMRPARREAVPA